MAYRIRNFLGEIPKTNKREIGDTNAQRVDNAVLTSGRLDTLYYPKLIATLVAGALTAYRLFSGSTDYWLSWAADVDVAKGPIAGDTSQRSYYTSDAFEPRVTNLAMATAGSPYPYSCYVLGVTPPTVAPTVTPSGGVATNESRAYVYTLVTQWGEESAPSPASTIATGHPDGTWTISGMQVAPVNSYTITAASWVGGVLTLTCADVFGLRAGEYVTLSGFAPSALNASFKVASVGAPGFTVALAANPGTITDGVGTAARNAPHNTTSMVKRIYRSVTSSSGTTYYYVGEVAVATTSTTDSAGSNIGEPIATTGWKMPPVDLRGIRMHPSGSMIGFSGNVLKCSEPLAPYAWLDAYDQTTDFPIAGIGLFGTAVVVATQGTPYVAQGVAPESFSMQKIDQSWPCVAKRGIVESGDGVIWPCPQGLAMLGVAGASLLTLPYYTQREWVNEYPANFIAAYHDNRYYAGYKIDASHYGVLIFDRADRSTISHGSIQIDGIREDQQTGALYILQNGDLKQWDADTAARMPISWWSKEFTLPVPVNLGAAKVEADFTTTAAEAAELAAAQAAQVALNAAMVSAKTSKGSFARVGVNKRSFNGSAIKKSSLVGDGGNRRAVFELFSGNDLKFSKTITSDAAFRLPSGFKTDKFSVRVTSTVPVSSILVGTTMDDLRTQ